MTEAATLPVCRGEDGFGTRAWQTATVDQLPQVGPHDVAAQDPQLPPADVFPTFPPNRDSSFFVFFDLQAGQETLVLSSLDLKRISKMFLHLLHSNS